MRYIAKGISSYLIVQVRQSVNFKDWVFCNFFSVFLYEDSGKKG